MKFPYLKFWIEKPPQAFPHTKTILCPIIKITLRYKDKKVNYLALIDSGADYCFFHKEIAQVLGIDVEKGKKLEFAGITGKKSIVYFHNVDLYIGGWRYKLYCGFSSSISPYGFGILGQYGFFDLFIVKFNLKREEIEIKPY